MDQKGFTNIIIIVLVVVLASVVGYLTLIKKQTPSTTTNQIPSTSTPTQPPINSAGQEPRIKLPSYLPASCKDESEGVPVITSLSVYSGPVGTKLEIRGCNFVGFEGDINAVIENNQGEKAFLLGELGSTSKIIKVTLKSPLCRKNTKYSGFPCDEWLTLTPGIYKIYTMPFGKKSNEVTFTILESTIKPVNWEGLIPDIKIVLQQVSPEVDFRNEDIEIYAKGDITGDSIPEALVRTICSATGFCRVVLMRLENNKPVIARVKQEDGKISYATIFADGAGGVGRYGSRTKLIEDKNAIYHAHHYAYNEILDSCGAEVYQWNPQTKIFEFNISLSNEAGQDYCSKICSELAPNPNLRPSFQRICR
jgi:hypothetical protein